MGVIYDTILRLFLTDERLSEVGIVNAVLKNWITEEEKLTIIASKPVDILPPKTTDDTPEHPIETEVPLVKIETPTEEPTL